jgi:aspartate aminotransferase
MKRKNWEFHHDLNLNVRGLSPSATLLINEKSHRLMQEGKDIIKLGLGQSPFPVPDIVIEALKKNAHQKDYLPVKGLYPLRESVAYFNKKYQKIESHPEDIMIGPGSKELIFILQLVYYGDLIIPTPSWVSYSPQAQIVGRHVHWVQTEKNNQWRLSPEKLEEICAEDPDRPRVVILNYPANPTGYSYPIERLRLLAQVARKYKVILVSDEIYGLIHHTDQHVSIARYYPEGTIVSGGLSKWCGAGGWRLGTFSFPPQLRWLADAMAVVASETYTSTSAPIQYAAIKAFEGAPEIDEYLHSSRKVLRIMARKLCQILNSMHVDVEIPQGAFYLFPDFVYYREKLNHRGIHTSKELCNSVLEEAGVAMLPGSDFGRSTQEMTCRMAYVDFNGAKALQKIREFDNGKNADDDFMRSCTPRLLMAMDRLKNWLDKL